MKKLTPEQQREQMELARSMSTCAKMFSRYSPAEQAAIDREKAQVKACAVNVKSRTSNLEWKINLN